MKLRLTSRIVLFFVLLAAALLSTVGVLSYRSGSESLKAAAVSEMLARAIEKEAAVDTWISHGFTTRKDGHGFRLHSGALMAKEMGGSLTVRSGGPGLGAAFTLELPLHAEREPL